MTNTHDSGDADVPPRVCRTQRGAYGDDFAALFWSSHGQNATIVSSFEVKEGDTRPYSLRSFILYRFYIVYPIMMDLDGDRFEVTPSADARDVTAGPLVAPPSERRSCLLTKFN